MTLRTPTLCLDTNASIDFGVVLNLHDRYDSLGEQLDGIKEYWESMHYDEHVKSDVCSMLGTSSYWLPNDSCVLWMAMRTCAFQSSRNWNTFD